MADKKTLELQIQVLANQAQQQIKLFATDIKNAASQVKEFTKNNQDIKNAMGAIQAEAQRATNSLKLFGGSASELRTQTQKMKSVILDLVENGLDPESDEIKNLVKQYKDLDAQIEKTETQQEGLAGTFQTLTKEIGTLAAVTAAVSFDKWVAGLAGSALSASTSFRAAKEDFGIMLGDMEAGAGLFAELQEFNFWTPFDLEQTSQAAKVLMAAKVPLKDMTEYLTRFGDISQGNGQRFQSFINAFSKASAKGKADMEVLNVYIDQGVQILDALGEQMGVTSAEIVDMASKGKVSFQDLDNALASLAAEGGLYYNSMATASQRLDARQAGLEESVNALAASYGDMLAPMAAKALEVFTNLIDTINNSPFLKGVLAAALAAVVVIINTQMIRALVAFAAKIWATYAAQMSLTSALSITNPLLLAGIAAVATATAGYVAYAAAQQDAIDASAELALKTKELDQAFKDMLTNATLTELQNMYTQYTILLQQSETKLQNLQNQLKNTPQFIYESSTSGYTIKKVENPEYSKIIKEITETQKDVAQFKNGISDISKEITKLKDELDEGPIAPKFDLMWQEKLLEGIDKIKYEWEKAKEDLDMRGAASFGKKFENNTEYQKELDALNRYFQKQIDELEKKKKELADSFTSEWTEKFLTDIEKLELEWARAIDNLKKEGEEKLGKGFLNNEKFKAEMDALNQYFQKQIDEMNEKGKVEVKVEIQKNLREVALSSIENTEVGQVAKGFSQGGLAGGATAALQAFINAVVNAVSALENGQKVLNFISTIVENIFKEIGELVNDALGPTVQFLETFGTLIGKILKPFAYLAQKFAESETFIRTLMPILEQLCIVFEVLFTVLQPVLDLLSEVLRWFGYVVNPLGGLVDGLGLYSEKTKEAAEELEKQNEMLKKKYERQAQAVEDLLQSQLDSLRSQYELGLISREEYESQAEKYAADADSKIYDINKEMEEHLKAIEANTGAVLSEEQKAKAESVIKNLPVVDSITGIADDISEGDGWGIAAELAAPGVGGNLKRDIEEGNWGKAALDVFLPGTSWIGKLFNWFDTGSPFIEHDQLAMVHRGEIIVPRTFADGIRSGDLALSSKNSSSNTTPVYVTVNVAGSVTTEAELTTAIYNGIANGIQARKYQPLPGA